MGKIQLGALTFFLSLVLFSGQGQEVDYSKILKNSQEIFKIGAASQLEQEYLAILEKDELNWQHRSKVHSSLIQNEINTMTATEEIKEMWQSMEKYSMHETCYVHLDLHKYSFQLISDDVINPYLIFLFREIDFIKAQCDSLKVNYDIEFQTKLRHISHSPDLAKYQKIIDQYHKEYNKLPTINEIGRPDINDYYGALRRSDKVFISKYIDEIRAQEKEKIFSSRYLAKLEDRLRFLDNKPSLYGTVVVEEGQTPYPIEDVQNINKRRFQMGLYSFGGRRSFLSDILTYYKIR